MVLSKLWFLCIVGWSELLPSTGQYLHAAPLNLPNTNQCVESLNRRSYDSRARQRFNRGVALHQAGLISKSRAEYLEAVRLDPRMSEAWHNLGCVYAFENEYLKATCALQKALNEKQNAADHFRTMSMLANLYCKHNDFAHAEPLCKEILNSTIPNKVEHDTILSDYIDLLTKTNRLAEAALWSKKN